MSNYSVLKQDINNNIYENQTQQITGTVLNAILNEMTNSLGAGYQFAGVATLGMNPADPDQRVFYLAGEGIYTNFGGLQVPAGKLGVLKWDNRWTLQTIDGLGGGGANLTGYVSVASTDDLPDEGVATLGYLCGENLYLYVGEGGDTKEGKYQNCGSFRGPQGDSVQDVEQTQTSLENGGVNKIKFTLSNGISCEFQVRNGTTSSGLFPTVEALQAAYPSPVVGQYAFVGAGFPADIYVCTTAGTWTDSGEDYDGDNVDLTDYATKAEVNQLEANVGDLSELKTVDKTNTVSAINEANFSKPYSVPIYVWPNKIINYSTESFNTNQSYDIYVFNVVKYAGQKISITTSGLPDPNTIWGILACQKTDGTVVYVQNTIRSKAYNYEYTLPEDAYKLAINKYRLSEGNIVIRCGGVIIESSYENSVLSLSFPRPTMDTKFFDTAATQNGILGADGVLIMTSSSFRTIKYDISAYTDKCLLLAFSAIADQYNDQYAAFMVETAEGNKTVHKDSWIGYVTTGLRYCAVGYKVQQGDKYLYVSLGLMGFVTLTVELDNRGRNPILFPIQKNQNVSLFEQELGTATDKGVSQKTISRKVQSVNLFNTDDTDIIEGQYIDAANNIVISSRYGESGFIPLKPGQILKWTNPTSGTATWPWLPVVFYDENKQYIDGNSKPSAKGYVQTTATNCYYVRFAFPIPDKNNIVISYDENIAEYVPYYDIHTLREWIKKENERIDSINESVAEIADVGTQWNGKKWYAYGTSITSIVQGTYAPHLAEMSGMVLTNKGIAGGGIGDLGAYSRGQVRNAIMNTTDGKLEADLITLEVGANDTGENVPLGSIYDTDDTTLCGCLNMCIRYLQANTNAQIVVFPSPATKTEPNEANKYYEAQLMFQQICFINKCYWIDGCTGLGYSRINGNNTYTADNIHQTELGGYIFAKSIWSRLKSIPTWDLSVIAIIN